MPEQDDPDFNIVQILRVMRTEQEAHDGEATSLDPAKRRQAKMRAGRVVQSRRLVEALDSVS